VEKTIATRFTLGEANKGKASEAHHSANGKVEV